MRELLVIADKKGCTQEAFFHALEVAKNTGASIEFVGFVYAAGVDSSEILTREEKRKLRHAYLDEKKVTIDEFISGVDLHDIKLKVDVVWEKSLESWVVSRCDQKSFDMIFKTGHRTETFLYTPTDWHLMRRCPDPVMIVGSSPWKQGGKILAALDLSSSSEKALQLNENILYTSFALSKSTNSEVHACYSIPLAATMFESNSVDSKNIGVNKNMITMTKSIDPVIRKLIQDAGLDENKLHLVSGNPAKEIVRILDEIKADVVVIGKKTRKSLRGRLMGTTAENVLHSTKTDVIVVR